MRSNISPDKLLANRNNAKLSTGPRTKVGKQNSAKNAISHGLSLHQDLQNNLTYQHIKNITLQEGYAEDESIAIAHALTEYRRVMSAYYTKYASIPESDGLYEVSTDDIEQTIESFSINAAKGTVSPSEMKQVINILIKSKQDAHQKDTKIMLHGTDMKRFIRYQRKSAAQVSKVLHKSDITKPK